MTTYSLSWDHGVTEDGVLSFAMTQSENDFAQLEIVIKNPRVGLLSGNLWATFSRNGTPWFYGRLVGVPENLQNESVSLLFIARPDTFDADKAALAETLKVLPKWDPVWIAPEQRTDPDTVLETYASYWHIDRVNHTVSISSIVDGEAGTVVIDPDDIPADSLSITYGETPAEAITCKAEVHWRQKAGGEFNLRTKLIQAFQAANSYYNGYITTYTGDGLINSWPKTGQSFGGGWEMGSSELLQDDSETRTLPIRMRTGGFKTDSQPPLDGGVFPIVRWTYDVQLEGNGDTSGDATLGGVDET